jgi:hypothetical protein
MRKLSVTSTYTHSFYKSSDRNEVDIMTHKTNNKRAYIVFGIMLALPVLLSLFIMAQLYATVMRFA